METMCRLLKLERRLSVSTSTGVVFVNREVDGLCEELYNRVTRLQSCPNP